MRGYDDCMKSSTKRALITGITGQDGSYLTELLLSKGYEVHGIVRRASSFNTDRLDALCHDANVPGRPLFLHFGDLADGTVVRRILERVQPAEIYNLAAQSHVKVSFEEPEYTADIVAVGTLRLLDSVADYVARTRKGVHSIRRARPRCSAEVLRRRMKPRLSIRGAHTQ